ncbi:transglutaminase-like domain-containing protein [Streptomyces spectabilis]|uniref:Tetratricopeptide repeat protein n=1 Tax=Streptomyces spectabilis TaxID=68270 RepID=A0A516RCW3_STRST|nr:transglutaminase-like domain-containing protein [Streptomyces spectabilis]QDQ13500.1 tetratricopeptide repeat protein [Streptomyces spectabilis]
MRAQPAKSSEWRRRFADEARSERPDLSLLCLLLSGEADPQLDEAGIDAAQIELDTLAGQLPYRPGGARAWAAAVSELLGGRHGFHGTATDYQRLESSLLHEVLRHRRGLPILLSVVWIEVARRAGAPVYGVALPGHFVVGFGGPDEYAGTEQVLADPFNGGRLLSREDAEQLVAQTTGGKLNPSLLTAAAPLNIMLRILNNIRAWASARSERSHVALWALELSLLLPSHPARLRYERAQLLVERGDFLEGARGLDEYADVVESIEPTTADRVRLQARAARSKLN